MTEMISFFDAFWKLMWFPLEHLSLELCVISCPLLILVIGMIFGQLFKFLRGCVR
jgi:hypothetical protein